MPDALLIARKKFRVWSPALFLMWAATSTGFGCVDITPPWQKAGWQKHDSGTSQKRDSGTSDPLAETGDEPRPAPNEDGATVASDTDQPTPNIDADDRAGDARLLDAPADESTPTTDALSDARADGQPAQPDTRRDARADTRTPRPDTLADVFVPRLDGGRDSSPDTSRPDSEDAPQGEDLGPNLDSLVSDTYVADLPVDTISLPADTGIEALPLQGLVAHYSCEGANGAVLADTSRNGWDAILANNSGATPPAGFSIAAGKVGNGLVFSAKDQAYVSLPAGIVSRLSQVTIATWVKLNVNSAFQRIFDFAVDTNTFMYLTNAGSSGNLRFRISAANPNRDQAVEGSAGLPVGTWVHAAVTMGNDGISIFVDGARVAQQAPAVLRPSDLGDTTNNYLGRSQFPADPYLDGELDEFRIYDRVLSATEIADLASGR